MFDQGVDDRLGVFAGNLYKHHVARLPLNQRRYLRVNASKKKIPSQ